MARSEPALRRHLRRALYRLPTVRRLIAERDELRAEVKRERTQRRRLKGKRQSLQRVLAEKDAQLGLLHRPPPVDEQDRQARQDLRFLFIVTYGRSGSTLLQGILSSTPGVLIRGENAGALYHLYRFHRACTREQRERTRTLSPRHPQFGIEGYPPGIALADIRALVLDTLIRPEPDCRVVGFKEIRWHQPDLEEYVDFLKGVFPGARFVVNTRDLDEVARSRWWADRPDAMSELQPLDKRLRALADALGPDAFHVHYNDYVADPSRLRSLFDWLGEEYDEQRVRQAMAVSYSY